MTYHFTPNFMVFAGYFVLDYDYSRHSGADEFGLDGRFEGPTLGGSIRF